MEDVINFCCDLIFSWSDESNLLEVDKLADLYGLQQLQAKVHSYMLRNIQTFSRTAVYRQLPPEKVFRVLCSNDLEVNSENEVYEAALHYHYSPEQVETDQACLQVYLKFLHRLQAVFFRGICVLNAGFFFSLISMERTHGCTFPKALGA